MTEADAYGGPGAMAAPGAPPAVAEVESFIDEYYRAWQGTDEDRIMSYYAENVTLQIPGTLMQGASAVREQFVRPFITAFPDNRHVVKSLVPGRDGRVVVEFTFDARHRGPFAGHPATNAHIEVPGCGVYEYDLAKRKITSARIYFDVGTLLKQILDESSRGMGSEGAAAAPAGTIAGPVEHLDLATAIAVSQAVSGETDLERLLETLMRTAVEHAGARRALLILSREAAQRVVAEATTSNEILTVHLCDEPVSGSRLPDAVLRYVLRTRESVILDDAAIPNFFSSDPYLAPRSARSVFCLPLTNQAKLIGALYLENDLAPRVFAPARTAVLKLLASQAAISIENSRLHRDLAQRESAMRRREEVTRGALETVAEGGPLAGVLDFLCRTMEEESRDRVVACIHPLTEDATAFCHTAAPSLDRRYREATDGMLVSSMTGPCCWAAVTRQTVVVPHVAADPRWVNFQAFVEPLGIRSAWSTPIFSNEGKVLGTFAHYYFEVRDPSPGDERMVELLTRAAAVAIERSRAEAALREINQTLEQRVRAETRALRESERESRLIVNTIPGLVAILTPAGEVDVVNDQLVEYCGQELDAMRQWGTNGTVHSEDVPGVAGIFGPAIASGVPYEFEARIRRFDGAYRWFQVRGLPLRDTQNQVARWYVLLSDVDDRKRAEVELRQAYDGFVDAQRLSKTGTFITDIVGDDHNWSEEIYRIFEFDPGSKVTLQRFRELVHPDDLPEFEATNARAMTGADVKTAFRIVTPRGAVKHLRGVAHVIGQRAGHPLFVGALQDVTESIVAEQALNRARSELAHAARVTTMGELTASIAHEVKQPISAAVTSAQTALRWLDAQPPELGEVREALSRIVRAGKRAGDVIGRIRALITKAPPPKESVDINVTIREVVELTRGEAVKDGVTVRTELAEGLPEVQGDRVQLQQVILNLIVNGIEAMTGAGEAPRDLRVSSRKDDAEGVVVAVADTGPGLAAGAPERVFAAFYTTKPGGLGLGLSICRSIIEAHEGRLWASANEPRGAVFQFTLPAPPAAAHTS